jgi:hypothetical protein
MKRDESNSELKRENEQLRAALRQCRELPERTEKLLHRTDRQRGIA